MQPLPAFDLDRTVIEIKQIDPAALGGADLDVLVVRHIEKDIAIAQIRDGAPDLAIGEADNALLEGVPVLKEV